MSRLLAAAAAVAMVLGAVAIRAGLDDGEGEAGATVALVCAEELTPACARLATSGVEVSVEPAAATADRLTAETPPDLDAWLAPAPWPAMVDDERRRSGLPLLFSDSTVVARSPLVVVGGEGAAGCGWRCLGDGAGDGSLRVGWPPPGSSSVGLLAVGAATAAWFGSAEVATNDFDPAFRAWLSALAAGARPDRDPVSRILQSRAFFDVAVSTEATAGGLLDAADPSRRAGLQLFYPEPVATVDIALAATRAPSGRLVSDAQDALRRMGWRPPGAGGEPPLPASSGVPRAGVLLVLREEVGR